MAIAEASDQCILVVEDNPSIGAMLEALLTEHQYQVTRAADGVEALAQIADRAPDLILLDLDIPLLDGFEVCNRVKQAPATRLIPIIVLTGQDPGEARMRAWDLGADEFLSKPIQCLELLARCRSLLRLKVLTDELETARAVMFAFARAVEAKSAFTQGHSQRVAHFSLLLAEQIGLDESDRQLLWMGSLLHDIGKISIPDAILNKPGSLTAAEFDEIKKHTIQGARIVEPLKSLRNIVPMIRSHHERLDGLGYPDGLAGDAIPLLVRVVSVTDVYDSLASMRPYRTAIPRDMCLSILRTNAAEGGLDPYLVEHFEAVMRTGRILADDTFAEDFPSSGNKAILHTMIDTQARSK